MPVVIKSLMHKRCLHRTKFHQQVRTDAKREKVRRVRRDALHLVLLREVGVKRLLLHHLFFLFAP